MTYRLTVGPMTSGARLIDLETGHEIERISAIEIDRLEAGGVVRITVELGVIELEIDALHENLNFRENISFKAFLRSVLRRIGQRLSVWFWRLDQALVSKGRR